VPVPGFGFGFGLGLGFGFGAAGAGVGFGVVAGTIGVDVVARRRGDRFVLRCGISG
jgi:F0F1-type ATP synthase membrane subunit c/vacuolar-type H+-ATPase subunit K